VGVPLRRGNGRGRPLRSDRQSAPHPWPMGSPRRTSWRGDGSGRL
jgi:hypothetical protein